MDYNMNAIAPFVGDSYNSMQTDEKQDAILNIASDIYDNIKSIRKIVFKCYNKQVKSDVLPEITPKIELKLNDIAKSIYDSIEIFNDRSSQNPESIDKKRIKQITLSLFDKKLKKERKWLKESINEFVSQHMDEVKKMASNYVESLYKNGKYRIIFNSCRTKIDLAVKEALEELHGIYGPETIIASCDPNLIQLDSNFQKVHDRFKRALDGRFEVHFKDEGLNRPDQHSQILKNEVLRMVIIASAFALAIIGSNKLEEAFAAPSTALTIPERAVSFVRDKEVPAEAIISVFTAIIYGVSFVMFHSITSIVQDVLSVSSQKTMYSASVKASLAITAAISLRFLWETSQFPLCSFALGVIAYAGLSYGILRNTGTAVA